MIPSWRHWRQTARVSAVVAALIVPPTPTFANGWEHGAVPFDALVDALDFEESPTRQKAAESLGFRGQPEAVPHLIAALERPEPAPSVRSAIYLALGNLGDPRARDTLLGCLETETREELRADCTQALGGIRDREVPSTLLRLILARNSVLVKARAVDALGGFDQPSTVEALGALAGGSTTCSAKPAIDRDALSAMSSRALAPRAIAALGQIDHPCAGDALAALLMDRGSEQYQARIVAALIESPSPKAEPGLRAIIESEMDDRLRAAATVALAAAGRRDDLTAVLTSLLSDPAPLVQYQAIQSLRSAGDVSAAVPLIAYASELTGTLQERTEADLLEETVIVLGEASLLDAAIRTLTKLDAAAGAALFLRAAKPRPIESQSAAALAVKSAFYQVRRAALYGLGYTNSPDAWRFLNGGGGISDPDARLRAVAARSIAVLGFEGSAESLITLLHDPKAEVRWTAADALGPLGDTSAVPALAKALADKDARVRESAARALSYLPAQSAANALRRLATEDTDSRVRAAAAFALERQKAD